MLGAPTLPTAAFRDSPAAIANIADSSPILGHSIILDFMSEFPVMGVVLECSKVAIGLEQGRPLACALGDDFDIILNSIMFTEPGVLSVQDG